METTNIKCEVSFEEGKEPLKIKDEPVEVDVNNIKSEPPDLSNINPMMYQANQLFQQKIKLENNQEEHLEDYLRITQERKIRSQQFSAVGVEGAQVFSCKMCKANYVSKLMLDVHIQQKHTTTPGWIHCQLCEYKFRKVNKFNEHMVACHGQVKKINISVPEEHGCTLCDFKCTNSFNLVTHMQKVHAEKPDTNGQFSCEACNFKALTINAIKSHRYLAHFQKNLEDANFDLSKLVSCVVCSTQLPNKEMLRKHLQEKHNMSPERDIVYKNEVKKFQCAYCDNTFQFRSKLESHEKIKHPDKESMIETMYKCKQCNFQPMTMFALEVHQQREHANDNGSIPKPPLPFKTSDPLKVKFSNISQRSMTSSEPQMKKVKMTNFNSRVPTRSIPVPLVSSKRDENGPLLVCTLCSYKSLKDTEFTSHMHKVHNRFGYLEEAKKYSCRICNNIFHNLLMFVGHKNDCQVKSNCQPHIENDIKKAKVYRCAICDERFYDQSIMKNHINTHNFIGPEGVKYYKCPFCNLVFKTPRLIVEHKNKDHKGEKRITKDPKVDTPDKSTSEEKDPLCLAETRSIDKIKVSLDEEPQIMDVDELLKSFDSGNKDSSRNKERNKANFESDDDGSDTSVDSDNLDEDLPKSKTSVFSCAYCFDKTKITYLSKDALANHQKDIFGLKKNDRLFVKPHLKCPKCEYQVQCEVILSKHIEKLHAEITKKKCEHCDFKTNLNPVMNHHLSFNHKNVASIRTCAVCGIVLRDKKNLAGHYFSKHNILDPSKLKNLSNSF